MYRKKIDLRLVGVFLVAFLAPVAANGGVAATFELPDTGYISNVVIDIVEHDGGVWFATGEGINFSFDNGETWLSYDNSNGLVSSSVSAIYSIGAPGGAQHIWVGTLHEEELSGELYTLSDGVSYSDDNGNLWTRIDFSPTGLDIPSVWGIDRTVYDITGHFDAGDPVDNWLFFTAFAGGFLASRDGGIHWRRIYASVSDSIQFNSPGVPPSYRNRYFSCAADTSHGDSLFVWAGTADGFFQYVYTIPREKLFSKYISQVLFCETCPTEDSNYVYLAGDNGLTRGAKTGGPYISRFEIDGLPGQSVISLVDFGGVLFAGTIDPADSSSTGLAESSDFGESFVPSASFPETGLNKRILDFAVMGDRLYAAAEEAGLFVTEDAGQTWTRIPVDTLVPSVTSRRNVVHALNAWGDTLRVGTDSGLVNLYLNPAGDVDSARYLVFAESDTSSLKVVRVKTQRYVDTDVIWTANLPLTLSGTPIAARSADGGVTFAPMQVGVISRDFDFFGDTAFVVGDEGIRFAEDEFNPSNIYRVREYRSGVAVDSLHLNIITDMEVLGDTVYFATDSGYAYSLNRGETYEIVRPNLDSLAADVVLHYTSDIAGLSGDFIPGIDIQYLPDTMARVWISNRPTFSGTTGISVGRIDRAWRYIYDDLGNLIDSEFVDIYNWDDVYDDFAWNFSFNGDTVFAATDGGLIYAEGSQLLQGVLEWDTLALEDSQGYPLIFEGTSVYASAVIDNYLWIGTGDRTVRVELTPDGFGELRPFFVIDSTDEVYAFPVPFSHTLDQAVEFHFLVDQDASVTLEVYDFAMNLVRRVIDNQPYAQGIYPTAGIGRRTWDGRNGNGDPVAVGVYYFKLELSTGEVRWGKLAVIP